MSLQELVLDDFEHNDVSKYQTNHNYVKSYRISLTNEQAKFGNNSLKVTYNFSEWITGNGALFVKFIESLSTDIMPEKLGVWVYSDGKIPWLRASIIDGIGERKIMNLTTGTTSWNGWRYLDAEIDSDWELPLMIEQIYAVEVDKTFQGDHHYQGSFYIDKLRFVYIDKEDLIGPVFTNITPLKTTIYKNSFTFSASITDAMSGVDPNSIVLKINQVKSSYSYCEQLGEISYDFKDVSAGTYHIEVDAWDFAGNKSIPNLDMIITVDLSPDTEKPILSKLIPIDQGMENTPTPRITFKLLDEKSGIDRNDIILMIDEIKQEVFYDEVTGWGFAISKTNLANGSHTLSLLADDRAGNKLEPIYQTFIVNALQQPINAKDFTVSIIPDVHSNEHAMFSFEHVNKINSDFVIQMGDLVDLALESEFKAINKTLRRHTNKSVITIPGNHESFQGDLEYYTTYFGAPTSHFIYGNTLFILLNTSYEQSISESDSMQFTYLIQVLNASKQKNIIIVTHVPTRDRFGTSHQMKTGDVNRMEEILENHKSKHVSSNITVLFGHLHVLDYWSKSGVDYIITGNSASKGYTSSANGNIPGYGTLHVKEDSIKYNYHPYISKLYFQEKNIPITEKNLPKDSYFRPTVFAETNEMFSHNQIEISKYSLIEEKWHSTNTAVVTVNNEGVIHAINPGVALVLLEVSGIEITLQITVN